MAHLILMKGILNGGGAQNVAGACLSYIPFRSNGGKVIFPKNTTITAHGNQNKRTHCSNFLKSQLRRHGVQLRCRDLIGWFRPATSNRRPIPRQRLDLCGGVVPFLLRCAPVRVGRMLEGDTDLASRPSAVLNLTLRLWPSAGARSGLRWRAPLRGGFGPAGAPTIGRSGASS